MPKLTVLDMTQRILSSMDSDDVNSISDTVESLQVASAIREAYYDIISNREFPTLENLLEVEGLGLTAKPNYLKLPADVLKIKWLKYNYLTDGDNTYMPLTYKTPEEFLVTSFALAGADETVVVTDFSGAKFNIRTDKNPELWTTFDNTYLVLDSYDDTLDTTLQASKTMAWGMTDPAFTLSDDFIPTLDANLFPMLLAEAKSICFLDYKQVTNSKAEQQSRRQLVRSQNDLHRANQRRAFLDRPNLGRGRG